MDPTSSVSSSEHSGDAAAAPSCHKRSKKAGIHADHTQGTKPPPFGPTILFDRNEVEGVAQNTVLEEKRDKEFKCRFCSKSYSKSQALGGHMNGHHEARDKEKWKEYERLCHKYPAANTNSRQGISSSAPFPQMQAGVLGVQSVGVLGQQQIHRPEQSWSNMKPPRHQNQPQLTHQPQGQQNHRSSLHLEPWQYVTSVGGDHLPNNTFRNMPHNPTALGLEAVDVNFQQKASMQVIFGVSLNASTTMKASSSSRFSPHQMLNPGPMGSGDSFDAGHGNNTSSAVTSHSCVNCVNPQAIRQVMHCSSPRASTYPPNPGVVSSLRPIPVQIAQDTPPFPQPAFACTTSNLTPPTSLQALVARVPSSHVPVHAPQQPLEDERDTSLQGMQTTFSSEQSMGVGISILPGTASNSDRFDDSFHWFDVTD